MQPQAAAAGPDVRQLQSCLITLSICMNCDMKCSTFVESAASLCDNLNHRKDVTLRKHRRVLSLSWARMQPPR
jgi:hypothetical protein